jgi:hypothetical protein
MVAMGAYGSSKTTNTTPQFPIHILYVNHVEVESVVDYIPPLAEGEICPTSTTRYNFTRQQLEWEMAQAESVGAYVSFHMSGAYAIKAIVEGDSLSWQTHLQTGHSVGVHAHSFVMGANPFVWINKTSANQQEKEKHWTDNHSLVSSLVGSTQLWVGESHYDCPTCWSSLGYSLRTTEAMAMLPVGKHIVWLVERDQKSVINYPHFPQIGEAGWHGPASQREYFDLRIPQLKKEFLLLYLEWLERERLSLAPQVWAWGWVNHGGGSTLLHAAEISEMLAWMSQNFVGAISPRGNLIAQFVNDHQIKQIYETFEQSGGEPLPSPVDSTVDQFPYLTNALADCGVIGDLSTELGIEGIKFFKMEKDSPLDSLPPLDTLYLIFRVNDGLEMIDIGDLLSAHGEQNSSMILVNVKTGDSTNVLANSLTVGSQPLILAPIAGYTCGDASGDATVDISDAVSLIAYIFSGGSAPSPLLAGDANCDSTVDISDAVYLIAYIFSGGSAPCAGC